MRSRLFLLTCMAMMLMVSALSAQTRLEAFEQANTLYQESNYDSAIVVYNRIIDDGVESAPLFFNLGNAYFKNGDLGHSILFYMRALRLEPGDDDIRANLEFARSFTRVQMEGVALNPVNSLMAEIVAPYRLNTLAWVSSAFFIILVLLLALRFGYGYRSSLMRTGIVLSLILLVVCSMITTFKYRHDYLTRRAVLVAEECPVFGGPSEEMDVELQGAPGLTVEILDESGDWYNVLFENSRRGWIRKDLVAEV